MMFENSFCKKKIYKGIALVFGITIIAVCCCILFSTYYNLYLPEAEEIKSIFVIDSVYPLSEGGLTSKSFETENEDEISYAMSVIESVSAKRTGDDLELLSGDSPDITIEAKAFDGKTAFSLSFYGDIITCTGEKCLSGTFKIDKEESDKIHRLCDDLR